MNNLLANMHKKACESMKNAYCKYSGLAVGACLTDENGQLYSGCNVENSILGLTQCAEENALATMINAGQQHIQQILIVSSSKEICLPCGSCRQLLWEFSNPELAIHIGNKNQIIKTFTLKDLLPFPFKNLIPEK